MTQLARWLDRGLGAVRRLGERRGCLFLTLLLVNAAALPYAGIVHDASLYAVQALNHAEGGAFDGDLYFRHGSQDQFSAFSAAAAPLVAAVGVPWAFFLLYLAGNAALLYGMLRLVEELIDDRLVSTLALLFLAAAPLPFGGARVFHVNENFLTPRPFASALVLLALAGLLRGRCLGPLLCLAAAALAHPILALAGLGVYLLWQGMELMPRRAFLALFTVAVLSGLALLACPAEGRAAFGGMDAEWAGDVWLVSNYNFPLDWEWYDWAQALAALAVTAGAALALAAESPRRARLLAAVAVVAAAGFLATVAASLGGYTLLFQAQPYRALWAVKVLQAPLTFWLAARLWRHGEAGRVAALLLLWPLTLTTGVAPELLLPLALLPCAAVGFRGLGARPRRADWASAALAVSVALGAAGWALVRSGAVLWLASGPATGALAVLGMLGPAVWLAVAVGAATARRPAALAGAACLAGALAVQTGAFLVTRSAAYRANAPPPADTEFVADFLRDRRGAGAPPTVYWPLGRPDTVWLDLRVNCYFDYLHGAGVLFSRATAAEGRRRAAVVAPFEVERFGDERALPPCPRARRLLQAFYGRPFDSPAPTRADLERLCGDGPADYAVLRHRFPGLYAATNGRLFIYDCRAVRAALGRGGPPITPTRSLCP